MTKPTYDEPDILYVHEGLVRFKKDEEPEMAFIMRAERKMGAWIAQLNRELGEANVKRENLPVGRTGWAVPYTLEEDARVIAQKHFAEVVPERPSLATSREEPQALKARPATQEEIVLGVFSVDTVTAEGANSEAVVSLAREGLLVRTPVSREVAALCARFIFEDVELVIRKVEYDE